MLLIAAPGCSTDLGLDEFKYSCEKDSDCGEGYACVTGRGCVSKLKLDGGQGDAAVPHDGGHDAGTDAGRDGGVDAGTDGGHDGGFRDAGFILQYSSTIDSAAGAGASQKYTLKAVTGWSTGPKRGAGGYQLKVGTPFTSGDKK